MLEFVKISKRYSEKLYFYFMIVSIKNEHLVVDFSTKGAELQRIMGTDSEVNYMWSGDAKFWGSLVQCYFQL